MKINNDLAGIIKLSVLVRRKSFFMLSLLCFLILIGFLISLSLGRFAISVDEFMLFLKQFLTGTLHKPYSDAINILLNIRLPRILMVVFVGAALSVSGAVFQAIFRNPLVSPDLLGVSSGAGFGALLALMFTSSIVVVQGTSFLFAILAVFVAYIISRMGRFNRILMLILAGIIVTAFFNALTSILKFMADPYNELPDMIFWSMGGFFRVGWREFTVVGPIIAFGIFILMVLRWKINIFSLGEDEAIVLGLNVRWLRRIFIFFASIIVASGISVCGTISWVGLIVPHMARMLVGPNHGIMLPVSALLGGLFLLFVDSIARVATAAEIPIGILTALLGAPFFCYIMLAKKKSGWA